MSFPHRPRDIDNVAAALGYADAAHQEVSQRVD
jgi:hypothetical protein